MNSEDLGGAPSPSDLQALAERLDGLSGPDRATDCELAVALDGFWYDDGAIYARAGYCHEVDGVICTPGQAPDMLVPKYTYSLDAAVALVERVLPGWFLTLDRYVMDDFADMDEGMLSEACADHRWRVWLKRGGKKGFSLGPTPPLALLRALVAAKMEEGRIANRDHPNAS